MLRFLFARDTMHRQRRLAAVEELGGYTGALPVPNSFPQSEEVRGMSYTFVATAINGASVPEGRRTSGASLDGKGEYSISPAQPLESEPQLASPIKIISSL